MKKILFAVFFLFSLISCDSNELNSVRIGSFSVAVDYGPYLIAKNKGWFEEALKNYNLSVDYLLFQSLPPINESFATNKLDIVFEAAPPAIVGKAAGIEIEIADISCTLKQEILVHHDSSINVIEDLKNKKISVLAGTSSHYGLLKALSSQNLKKDDVEIIDMIPPDAKSAFQTKQIDAWAVWPPWVEQEELSGNGKVLPGSDAYINSVLVVRKEFKAKNKEVFNIILEVFNKTKRWMIENQEESIEIIANELKLEKQIIERAWPKHNWDATINSKIITDIQRKADFLTVNDFINDNLIVKGNLILHED